MLATVEKPTVDAAREEFAAALAAYIRDPSLATERNVTDLAKRTGVDWRHEVKKIRRQVENHRHVKTEGKRLKQEAAASAAAYGKLEKSIREQVAALERTLAEAGAKNAIAQAAARDVLRREAELKVASGELTTTPDPTILAPTTIPGISLSKPARLALNELVKG